MNRTIVGLALMCFGLAVSACVHSSGVVSTGPDTYMIARTEERMDGSSNNVKAAVIKEADEYCRSRGKVLKIISVSQKDMIPFKSDATAEVQFKALDPNDPELRQDNVSSTPRPQVTNPPPREDLFAQLTKLNELRRQGVLTDEEFQAQKKRLLDKAE